MSKSVEEIKKSCDGKVKTEITKFYPIGRTSNKSFSGTFEGNTKTISNLTIDMTNETNYSDKNYVGLFGYSKGTIKGLTLDNVDIKGGMDIGGLTGYLEGGTVSEVILKGTIEGDRYIGGITGGRNYEGKISSVIVNANVTGNDYAAPISSIGSNIDGAIVEGGNISGELNSNGNINNFYYIDGVTAKKYFYATKIDKQYLHNLSYYSQLKDSSGNPIIETEATGDVNGTGYVFGYDSNNNIIIERKN